VATTPDKPALKPLEWIGSSKADLSAFPGPVRREAGYALYLAQTGARALKAKPLVGFRGASVLEVVADHDGNTYRAVYTVRFAKAIYVVHAFQKKSKKRSATPKSGLDLIKQRLRVAAEHYDAHYGSKKP
jgi:phage-related protein